MDDVRPVPAVRTKAVMIDPADMSIVWLNEAASDALPAGCAAEEATIAQIVPRAVESGLPEALAEVARTSQARHVQTGLVSTGAGSVAIVTSVYALPHGMLLMLTENAWQPKHRGAGSSVDHRRGRR